MDVVMVQVTGPDAAALTTILADAEENAQRLRAAMGDGDCRTYAGRVAGRTIGAAIVRFAVAASGEPEPTEIVYLAVAPVERGRGYGRRIVAAIQSQLRTGTLLVGTANSSIDNIAFYQRCGFRMREIRRGFFGDVRPPLREYGIVMRDMIVFDYAASDR